MKVLVTGSSGLIGSDAVAHFDREGHRVYGNDDNMRREFFGPAGDTLWNLEQLRKTAKNFRQFELDIRERAKVIDLFKQARKGDHNCSVSNLTKFRSHYPTWRLSGLLDRILEKMVPS